MGSANASQNGLLGEGEQAATSNVEAAVQSHDPTLAREVKAWFEQQWCDSSKIEDQDLARAREIWKRRQRSGGRGFNPTLIEKIRIPGPLDRFSSLRLIAYLGDEVSQEAKNFVGLNAGLYYSDEEWQDFGEENPWYEWPLGDLNLSYGPGIVFMDFTCSTKGGEFTFNGFWEMRQCPNIELVDAVIQLTLLTKLPHFNGYSLSPEEKAAIASKIRKPPRNAIIGPINLSHTSTSIFWSFGMLSAPSYVSGCSPKWSSRLGSYAAPANSTRRSLC